MYFAKIEYFKLLHLHRSARALQRWWRATAFLLKFNAALTVQRIWRGFWSRSRVVYAAAMTIQRIWRGFWAQLQYQIDLMDIITVQCLVRKLLAAKEYRRRSAAVDAIQKAASRMRLVQEKNRHSRIVAAIKIEVSPETLVASFTQVSFMLMISWLSRVLPVDTWPFSSLIHTVSEALQLC